MIRYFVWAKYNDEEFRKEYLFISGETVQIDPLKHVDGIHFMVGSSRIAEDKALDLMSSVKELEIYNKIPEWWESKEEEDEHEIS